MTTTAEATPVPQRRRPAEFAWLARSAPASGPSGGLVVPAPLAKEPAADVRQVMVSGVDVVRDGHHLLVDNVPGELAAAISAVVT